MSSVETTPSAPVQSAAKNDKDPGKSAPTNATVNNIVNGIGMFREPSADNSLDTVRNILFGEQLREVERKQASLERLIRVSVNSLNEDTQKRFAVLRDEVGVLKELLEEEAKGRREEMAVVNKTFSEHYKALEEQDKAEQAGRQELHARMSREVERLEQRIAHWRTDILAQVKQTVDQLQAEKADRKAVAAILNGMAKQLFDDEKSTAG